MEKAKASCLGLTKDTAADHVTLGTRHTHADWQTCFVRNWPGFGVKWSSPPVSMLVSAKATRGNYKTMD